VTRSSASVAAAGGRQLAIDGIATDDDGDPDACCVCGTRRGKFTAVMTRGEVRIVCHKCAASGWAPTLSSSTK
jgi:hypothetical protein